MSVHSQSAILERLDSGGVIVDSGEEGFGPYWAENEQEAHARRRVLRVVKAGNPSVWRSQLSGRPLEEALRTGEHDH